MMTDHVTRLAERIFAINWVGSVDTMDSWAYLMKEYLRRAAWWAKATNSQRWPFFDIAAAVNTDIRADPSVVKAVEQNLKKNLRGVQVMGVCVHALHFAALLDERIDLPQAPALPFEPLIVMFERSGSFSDEGSGLIDVGVFGIKVGTVEENLQLEPIVQLDTAVLDALD